MPLIMPEFQPVPHPNLKQSVLAKCRPTHLNTSPQTTTAQLYTPLPILEVHPAHSSPNFIATTLLQRSDSSTPKRNNHLKMYRQCLTLRQVAQLILHKYIYIYIYYKNLIFGCSNLGLHTTKVVYRCFINQIFSLINRVNKFQTPRRKINVPQKSEPNSYICL